MRNLYLMDSTIKLFTITAEIMSILNEDLKDADEKMKMLPVQ